MKTYCIFVIAALISVSACKKSDTVEPSLEGTWIEASLRRDTLNFSSFGVVGPSMQLRSAPYLDQVQNPNVPINHSSFYSYSLAGDSLSLRILISSSTVFSKFKFSFAGNGRSFMIAKFYNRRALPEMIVFDRLP